jgi:hypothetical protein
MKIDPKEIVKKSLEVLRGNMKSIMTPPGEGFMTVCLPFPNGGLNDSTAHNWEIDTSLQAKATEWLASQVSGSATDFLKTYTGTVPDPGYIQVYKGSNPRQWSCNYTIIPSSKKEAEQIKTIILMLKKSASPSKGGDGGNGNILMNQPLVFEISFMQQGVNGTVDKLISFNPMACTRVDVSFFTNGYPTTYEDGFPKQINISLGFSEYGLKYSEDWKKVEGQV